MTGKNYLNYLRIKDWWNYVLPPILLFYYLGLVKQPRGISEILLTGAAIMLLSVLTAIIGFYLNDLFDIKADALAGKFNFAATRSRTFHLLFLPLMFLVLFLLDRLFYPRIGHNSLYLMRLTFGVNLVLFLLYSVPPIRLKSSRYFGVMTDALYSGTIFYLMAYSMTEGEEAADQRALFLIFLWGFLKGIRNYLNHLADDHAHDAVSGQATLSTDLGMDRIQAAANRIFPLETGILGVLLVLLVPGLAIATGLLCGLFLWRWGLGIRRSARGQITGLNDLHEIWLPLLLAVYLVYRHPACYPVLLLHSVLFPNYLDRIYYYTFYQLFGPLRKQHK